MTDVIAYVALGANLSDPVRQVVSALAALDSLPGTHVTKKSALYRTAPVGNIDQPEFVNAVAEIETRLPPHELLAALLALEARQGRVRAFPNAPRTLDLDVLLYDNLQLDEPGLTIPHPRMHERGFVLVPLREIAPECISPGRGVVSELLSEIDTSDIRREQPPTTIA